MKISTALDTSSELLVQRYRNGIQLIKPSSDYLQTPENSVSHIYNLPINSYFYDFDSKLVSVNSACSKILGADSNAMVSGKYIGNFLNKEFGERILKNNQHVINSTHLNILEEIGERSDDYEIRTISFKYPWYFENQVIGVFGCSVVLNENASDFFAKCLSAIAETGLLMPVKPLSSTLISNEPQLDDCSLDSQKNQILSSDIIKPRLLGSQISRTNLLTKREDEVLHVLAKGKTINKIAVELGISSRTVETHLIHIKHKHKLNLKHREDLIAFYWNLGRPT